MRLYDYNTGEEIGPATPAQIAAGDRAVINTPDGAFLVDADGTPTSANSQWAVHPTRVVYTA